MLKLNKDKDRVQGERKGMNIESGIYAPDYTTMAVVDETLVKLDHFAAEIATLRRDLIILRHFVVLPHSAADWARVINRALETAPEREQCDALIATIPPKLRRAVAVEVYRLNDQLTLARAADIAGVFTWEMADVLREHGIEPETPEVTVAEMERQMTLLENQP